MHMLLIAITIVAKFCMVAAAAGLQHAAAE